MSTIRILRAGDIVYGSLRTEYIGIFYPFQGIIWRIKLPACEGTCFGIPHTETIWNDCSRQDFPLTTLLGKTGWFHSSNKKF